SLCRRCPCARIRPVVEFLRLIAVFVLIILLLRRHLNLGLVMLIGAVALGLVSQIAPQRLLEVAWNTATQFNTINLAITLILIMFLENLMRKTLMMRQMVESLTSLIGDRRVAMALLPAFIGFLPSAGGAMFSAPMVGEVTREMPMTPETKSYVNVWYRHIWEYIFPLYPGLILAAQVANVPIGSLILAQLPLTITAIIVGTPLAYRGLGSLPRPPANLSRENVTGLAIGVSPVLAVIVAVLVLHLDMSLSLGIVVSALLVYHRYTPPQLVGLVREAFSFSVVLLVFGVLLFKDILATSGSVDNMLAFFSNIGVPPLLLILLFPFAVGVLTGYAQAFVGVAFPIVIGLGGAGPVDLRLLALAYAAGFAGIMLSPAHLCLVLTIEHFKASIGQVMKMLVVPEATIVLVAIGLYLVR
ncbi:MAG: DUF401 family protein, partial [Chloroflexota bacterium]